MGYFKNPWKDGIKTLSSSIYGFREHDDGYIEIYEPNHPNSPKDGWIREHRWIMSQYINRPLNENEVVHHKNGFKKDNSIENLELLDRLDHIRLNYRDIGYDKTKIYCYLCGSDKTDMKGSTPNWHFDIDKKILCHICYMRITMRHKLKQKGIKPRVYKAPRKPVFESRILAEFTISNRKNTVTTEITV
jgi:hypothetical protein